MSKFCCRCGRHSAEMIFSKWTRQSYCVDMKACDKRAARRAKLERVPA